MVNYQVKFNILYNKVVLERFFQMPKLKKMVKPQSLKEIEEENQRLDEESKKNPKPLQEWLKKTNPK